jgi:hypothetical protein
LKNINRMKHRIILTLQQNSHSFIVASRELSGSILNTIIRHPGTVQHTASTLSDPSHVEWQNYLQDQAELALCNGKRRCVAYIFSIRVCNWRLLVRRHIGKATTPPQQHLPIQMRTLVFSPVCLRRPLSCKSETGGSKHSSCRDIENLSQPS